MSIILGTNQKLLRNNVRKGNKTVARVYRGADLLYQSEPTNEYWDFPNPQTSVQGWGVTLGTIGLNNGNIRWRNGGTVGSYAFKSLAYIPDNTEVEFTFNVANLLAPLNVYLDGTNTGNVLVSSENYQKFIVNVGTASQLRLYGTASTLGNHVFAKAFYAGVVL